MVYVSTREGTEYGGLVIISSVEQSFGIRALIGVIVAGCQLPVVMFIFRVNDTHEIGKE
jgi:hypothetical protein